MARIRTIKPGFFRHADLYDAEVKHGMPLRMAFAGLWTAADREGRFAWKPRSLKLDCLPFDDVDFGAVLDALAAEGFLIKYKVGADTFGCIPSWSKHQQVNSREAASEIPSPDEAGASMCTHMSEPVQDRGEGKGREQEGKGTYTATQTEKVPSVAPAVAPSTTVDLKKAMFDSGTAFLKTNGLKESDARAMIGKWRRDHGEVATVMALATAEGAAVSDPIPYIQAILRSQKNGKSNGKQPVSDHPLGIFGEMGDELSQTDGGYRDPANAKAVN